MPAQDAEPSRHDFPAGRLRLSYLDWGNAAAPTLLLVHGARDHARSWDWVAGALRHEWHVVAPDLRGHGDSDWSADGAYAMPDFVHDLVALVDRLAAERVTIVAHSLGGSVALRYAGLYPERVARIVAIEGMGPSAAEAEAWRARPLAEHWRAWIDAHRAAGARVPRRYPDVEAALARMRAANPHLSDEQARHLTIHGLAATGDGGWRWKFDNALRAVWPYDLEPEAVHALWRRIACPALLVYGSESWATDPRTDGRADHIRDRRVAMIEGAGHWPHHDRFDAFMAAVRAFLSP